MPGRLVSASLSRAPAQLSGSNRSRVARVVLHCRCPSCLTSALLARLGAIAGAGTVAVLASRAALLRVRLHLGHIRVELLLLVSRKDRADRGDVLLALRLHVRPDFLHALPGGGGVTALTRRTRVGHDLAELVALGLH